MRELSEESERQVLRLSSKRLICPGSELIHQNSGRESELKSKGRTITDWLHADAFDRRKKQHDSLQRTIQID